MNYLKLILRFWKLRRSKRITNLQADLYFYLIQECNERDWENPFECANKLICGSITISEPSLIDARNRLQQLGLIEFKSGKRNENSPVYFITDSESNLSSNLNLLSRNQVNTLVEPLDETEEKASPIKEQTKRKPNKKSLGDKSPPEEKRLYWKKFVDVFENFYIQKTNSKYIYSKKDWGCIEKIYDFLKKRSAATNLEWSENNCLVGFASYLKKAYEKDNWLKKNFSIPNILSQFNQIANATTGQNTHQQPPAGGKQTGADLLANRMAANFAQYGNRGATNTQG